jgi:hypothetical protein
MGALASAAWNSHGRCQIQSVTAWSGTVTEGRVKKAQARRVPGPTIQARALSRAGCGRAQSRMAPGRASTKSGAAIRISSSCSTMCSQNTVWPSECSGVTTGSSGSSQARLKSSVGCSAGGRKLPALPEMRQRPIR